MKGRLSSQSDPADELLMPQSGQMTEPVSEEEFKAMVRAAIDRIPEQFRKTLENVAIVISDQGVEQHAYGQYWGDGFAREDYPDRIVIFRDTLVRDFGHDRRRLAAEVERTVRHEVGHHLGFDEPGVEGLGL
jgi:predicted Zn-dependent protease with MMP-like domain